MDSGFTRIKICGVTRPEDAVAAADLGVDAIGLVFYDASSRAVSVDQAAQIVAAVPPLLTIVALFVDASVERIETVLERVPVGLLQFHGDESPGFCARFNRPYLKALRMSPDADPLVQGSAYRGASGLLLDTYQPGVAGGTGEVFDWATVPAAMPLPLVLAGGLNAANVAAAIARLHPAAVDVSGGVESAPGIKDAGKMTEFVRAVRRADAESKPGSRS